MLAMLRTNYGRLSPAADQLPALAELWTLALADVPDTALIPAAAAYIADPEHGQWWPTLADLRRHMPSAHAEDLQVWGRILQRIAGGRYGLNDLCDAEQRSALAQIGGSWTLRQAQSSAIPAIRREWLAAVAHRRAMPPKAALPAPQGAPKRLGGS